MRDLIHELDSEHGLALPEVFRVPPRPRFTREQLATAMRDDETLLLVAERGGIVAGCLYAELTHPTSIDEAQHPWCTILDLTVRTQDRRAGAGTALVRAAERWAFRKGLAEVRLTVWDFNAPAPAFYARLGVAPLAHDLGKRLDATAAVEGREAAPGHTHRA